MQRRKLCREFRREAVKLIRDRGAAVAQAARDPDHHENVRRKWPAKGKLIQSGSPGDDQMKPEQQQIKRLRRDLPG
jgi:transposase